MTYDKFLSFKNEYYKELYYDGVRQRNDINNKFVPTITILSAESGGLIWCILKYLDILAKCENMQFIHLVSFIFLAISSVVLFFAIKHFINAFTNYDFSYPNPEEVKIFLNEKEIHFDEYSEDELLEYSKEELAKEYIKMAIENCEETNKHVEFLNKSYKSIIWGLALLAITFLFIACI